MGELQECLQNVNGCLLPVPRPGNGLCSRQQTRQQWQWPVRVGHVACCLFLPRTPCSFLQWQMLLGRNRVRMPSLWSCCLRFRGVCSRTDSCSQMLKRSHQAKQPMEVVQTAQNLVPLS